MSKNNSYSGKMKLEVVKAKLMGDSNIRIRKVFGIKSDSQIKAWVKKYKEFGEQALFEDNRGKVSGVGQGRPRTKFNSLEEENAFLKKEVEWLKKSIEKKHGIKFKRRD